jgi:hypothetical protein
MIAAIVMYEIFVIACSRAPGLSMCEASIRPYREGVPRAANEGKAMVSSSRGRGARKPPARLDYSRV